MASLLTFAQCPGGQTEVTIDVGTDNWGYEIYWELAPIGSNCGSANTIFSGGIHQLVVIHLMLHQGGMLIIQQLVKALGV